MKITSGSIVSAVIVALAGCGGGGSTSPSTPAPIVSLSIDQSKVVLGQSAKLTWSSTNATSCTASGSWAGTQATSGTATQLPNAPGQTTYTLTCTGAGGNSNQSVTLAVPIPVQKSSYENTAIAGESIGAQTLPSEVIAGNAVAFADFFQDGTYSMVTHSLEYNAQDPSTASKFGHIHFWQKINGIWVDNTSKLLTDNSGCLHPRKAIVADFNGTGRPSIFFACHGFDASPFPGESPHLLLSQSDGTYKNVTLPITCFCHSASAADVNHDGYPDILFADNMIEGKPFFLINNKDGTFTKDTTRLPSDTMSKPIFTTEMIDFNHTGQYDVFLGGHEQQSSGNWPATIMPNDGAGGFITTNRVVLPAAQGYGFPLDIVFKAGNIYLLRTIDAPTNFYGGAAIQKIVYPSLSSQLLYQHTGAYSNGSTWINWIIPNSGNVVSENSFYGVSVQQ